MVTTKFQLLLYKMLLMILKIPITFHFTIMPARTQAARNVFISLRSLDKESKVSTTTGILLAQKTETVHKMAVLKQAII